MDTKIRVSGGIRIEVNDNGDCIVAHVEDHNFIDNFYGLIEKFEGIHKELIVVEAKNISKEEQLQLVKAKMQEITGAIDGLFGEDTCSKVFGEGVIPSGYLIAEFFEQLTPIFREYTSNRQRTISEKYSRKSGHGSKRHGGKRR